MLPPDERTPPMTPQLALRVALVGGFALLLFAVIFFRLWFLQVLTGSQYVAQAKSNVIQHVPVAAPRGEIVDSSGDAAGSVGGGSFDPDRATQPSRSGGAGRRTPPARTNPDQG